MKLYLLPVIGLLASGCVTQPETPAMVNTAEVPADRQEVVCTMEKPTGSNRPVKVCRNVSDAIDREQTSRDMRVLQRQVEILTTPK